MYSCEKDEVFSTVYLTLLCKIVLAFICLSSAVAAMATSVSARDTPPRIIEFRSSAISTSLLPFPLTIRFDKPVTGFGTVDLVLSNGASATLKSNAGDQRYNFDITPVVEGVVSINVDPTRLGLAHHRGTQTIVDTALPSLSIADAPTTTDSKQSFSINFLFSETVFGFAAGDVALKNGSILEFTGTGSSYSARIQPSGNGDVAISVPMGVANDVVANPNLPASIIVKLSEPAPVMSNVIAVDTDADDGEISWEVSFSKPVTGVGMGNFDIAGTSGSISRVAPVGAPSSQAFLKPEPQPFSLLNEFFGVRSAYANTNFYTTYRVSASGGDLSFVPGSVTLMFKNSTGIKDSAGNTPASTSVSNNSGATININAGIAIDEARPDVAISSNSVVTGTFEVTFTFSEPVQGFDLSDIAVTNAALSSLVATDASNGFASVWTVDASPSGAGNVTLLVNENTVSDKAGNLNRASGTHRVVVTSAPQSDTRTSAIANNFLRTRGQSILATSPDLSNRLNDRASFAASNSFAFSALGDGRNLSMSFAGNFAGSQPSLLSNYALDGSGRQIGGQAQPYNIWISGSYSRSDTGTSSQDFGVIHLGADYRFNEFLLAGVVAQFDWASEKDSINSYEVKGQGWLAGPYLVARLHERLLLDARVAWGGSRNEIRPFGTYSDRFSTSRLLAQASLTGHFEVSGWTVKPQISTTYWREVQKSYTDTLGNTIPTQTVELGQVKFGPTISRDYTLSNGLVVAPSLGVRGIWTFADSGVRSVQTGLINGSQRGKFSARFDAGLNLRLKDSLAINFNAFHEGLGDSLRNSYGGSAELNVRF
jgi:outer membrane autotransporter protein